MDATERTALVAVINQLNDAAEEFRASRTHVRAALLALIEANDAQVRSMDKVIAANVGVIDLLNRNGAA